ncbi:hypothetical protein BGZ82_003499 [Podila clonocystis]|nr:hypothetical protein BGZ82_003499 [Podila clonocystis]
MERLFQGHEAPSQRHRRGPSSTINKDNEIQTESTHSESTNAALIEAHSEEWFTRTFDKWWIEAVVIPLSVWHSSHVINVINPTLVATHKRKLYQLNGELDPLQMDNNGFTAVEIEKFSEGFPSDWQEVLKNWASQRSQDNQVNTLPGPTPPPRKYSENSSCESTAEEEQLASLPSPPRQPSPIRLPKARKRLVKAALIKDENQPMARTLRTPRKVPEPSSEEEESVSEELEFSSEEEESASEVEESAPEEPSTRTLRSSRKAPESLQEKSSSKEPPTRTRRSSRIALEPSLEEESTPEERVTRSRRSSGKIALELSASEYEPAQEVEPISDDSTLASSLTSRSLKRNRTPKGFYKAMDSTEQDDASGREPSSPMESKKRRRLDTDADEFVPPNEDLPKQIRVGVYHKSENIPKEVGIDSNRILRGLSADSVEVLPTRLRSESRTATSTSPTTPKSPASSRSLRFKYTVSPPSPSSSRTRSRRVSVSKAATAPKRLVLEAVVIPVWNRNKAAKKGRLEPDIKEEEEYDDSDEEGLEMVDRPPPAPLNALTWHPSLSTFMNFRPASMSPSLYTRSQNVVEQLKRQTSGDRMGEEMEEGQEESDQGEGMNGVVTETDKSMERNG